MTTTSHSGTSHTADITAIRRLQARYTLTSDQAEMVVDEIFTHDVRFEVPGAVFSGLEEVRAFFDARKPAKLADLAAHREARHQMTTTGIDITGPDSATGNTYFLLVKLGQITQMGSYLDLYRKVGGDWRIAERNVVLHFMADTPG